MPYNGQGYYDTGFLYAPPPLGGEPQQAYQAHYPNLGHYRMGFDPHVYEEAYGLPPMPAGPRRTARDANSLAQAAMLRRIAREGQKLTPFHSLPAATPADVMNYPHHNPYMGRQRVGPTIYDLLVNYQRGGM